MAVLELRAVAKPPNFGNWWFEPVFSPRMVPEGVDFGAIQNEENSTSAPLFSIVIPAYNDWLPLEECL